MPHPTEKVEFALPTGTIVRWPAPTFTEARQLVLLLDDTQAKKTGAFQQLVRLVGDLAAGQPELEELVLIEVLDVALSFSMAPRVRTPAPEPAGPATP